MKRKTPTTPIMLKCASDWTHTIETSQAHYQVNLVVLASYFEYFEAIDSKENIITIGDQEEWNRYAPAHIQHLLSATPDDFKLKDRDSYTSWPDESTKAPLKCTMLLHFGWHYLKAKGEMEQALLSFHIYSMERQISRWAGTQEIALDDLQETWKIVCNVIRDKDLKPQATQLHLWFVSLLSPLLLIKTGVTRTKGWDLAKPRIAWNTIINTLPPWALRWFCLLSTCEQTSVVDAIDFCGVNLDRLLIIYDVIKPKTIIDRTHDSIRDLLSKETMDIVDKLHTCKSYQRRLSSDYV